ncbi:MAG TPA: cytochrome P450, partial [Alphaproteobacteria bacterium]|nr:cytochrome P450 [Alphaproteobacteria bacterium]
ILVENHSKGAPAEFLYPIVGKGVFLAEGEAHARQRKMAAPYFTPRSHVDMVVQMVAATHEMFERWQVNANRPTPLRLDREFPGLAFNILLRALFHETNAQTAAGMQGALKAIFEKAGDRMWQLIKLPAEVVYNVSSEFRQARRILFETADDLIARRREALKDPDFEHKEDLLSQLVKNYGISKEDQAILRHEVITYLVAGHETTGQGLTFASAYLSQNPQARERLRKEVDSVLKEADPTFDNIRNLELPEASRAADEALRLSAPAPIVRRRASQDIYAPLDDGRHLFIPKGHLIMVSPWVIHRRKQYWGDNAETFDLDHFAGDQQKSHLNLPFASGPRNCIGGPFARTEMIVVGAMLAARYELSVVEPESIKYRYALTTHPDRPVEAYVKARETYRAAA